MNKCFQLLFFPSYCFFFVNFPFRSLDYDCVTFGMILCTANIQCGQNANGNGETRVEKMNAHDNKKKDTKKAYFQ